MMQVSLQGQLATRKKKNDHGVVAGRSLSAALECNGTLLSLA